MIHIRRAAALDARAMATLLNAIIEKGGTTALTDPVEAADILARMERNADRSAWHVAETAEGEIVGFQWIAPRTEIPPEACDIATFVQIGRTGLGIGSKLFDATAAAARTLGYAWINAEIRADNEGGLIYYQSRGFEDWMTRPNYRLGNGQTVTKIWKRYDL